MKIRSALRDSPITQSNVGVRVPPDADPTLNPLLAVNVVARYNKAKAYIAQRRRAGNETSHRDVAKYLGIEVEAARKLLRRMRSTI